jgi:hypothetical protein
MGSGTIRKMKKGKRDGLPFPTAMEKQVDLQG